MKSCGTVPVNGMNRGTIIYRFYVIIWALQLKLIVNFKTEWNIYSIASCQSRNE